MWIWLWNRKGKIPARRESTAPIDAIRNAQAMVGSGRRSRIPTSTRAPFFTFQTSRPQLSLNWVSQAIDELFTTIFTRPIFRTLSLGSDLDLYERPTLLPHNVQKVSRLATHPLQESAAVQTSKRKRSNGWWRAPHERHCGPISETKIQLNADDYVKHPVVSLVDILSLEILVIFCVAAESRCAIGRPRRSHVARAFIIWLCHLMCVSEE